MVLALPSPERAVNVLAELRRPEEVVWFLEEFLTTGLWHCRWVPPWPGSVGLLQSDEVDFQSLRPKCDEQRQQDGWRPQAAPA